MRFVREGEIRMLRWVLVGIAAIIVLPWLFKLLGIVLSLAFSVLYIALIVAAIIFVVGLVRRMLVAR
jgi:hypothetical protein